MPLRTKLYIRNSYMYNNHILCSYEHGGGVIYTYVRSSIYYGQTPSNYIINYLTNHLIITGYDPRVLVEYNTPSNSPH